MTGVLLVLLVLAVVGAFDTLYFHIWKLRLYGQPECRWEVLSHAGHGFSAALIFVLCAVDATGRWAWLYVVAAVFQALNQTFDTVIEPRSRRNIGGVPDAEYSIHGVLNCLWGAALALLVAEGLRRLPGLDAIEWRLPSWPLGLAAIPYLGAAISLGFGLFDLVGFFRLGPARVGHSPR